MTRIHWGIAGVGMAAIAIIAAIHLSPTPPSEDTHQPEKPNPITAQDKNSTTDYAGKRVLEIDAYHEAFPWTASITQGVRDILEPSGVTCEVLRLDTKRKSSPEDIKQAVRLARQKIDDFKPDVVIASDDNVAKHLIVPHYRNGSLPFVFVGVNWSADEYGFPCSNVTGQVEVTHIQETIDLLRRYAKGDRIGVITGDTFTEHKDVDNFKKVLGVQFVSEHYVKTFEEWKESYKALQSEVDMFILGNYIGIEGFDNAKALDFIRKNARIPSGTYNEEFMEFAVVGIVKDPREIGHWAAQTALRILDGESPGDIPVTRNEKGILILNIELARRLGITFEPALLETARIVGTEGIEEPRASEGGLE